jgi:hypothetical protein
VQGHLRNESLTVVVDSECAHCRQPLRLEFDSDLNYRVMSEGALPLISVPMVDIGALEDPSIIDAF